MRLGLLVVLVSASALSVAALAPTKEGARARLTRAVPLDAPARTTLRVDWTVDVLTDTGERRPFGAIGMFVRLLSRTGAPSTLGLSGSTGQEGRYAADVTVPAGGIGGIRVGLRGSTDIVFALENDPFATPDGVRCDVATLRATLTAFVRAYNAGDLDRLDSVFSRKHFVWYTSTRPGIRLQAEAQNRETLVAYFRQRHRRGDRLSRLTFRFNGYERQRGLGHFEIGARRRADDFRGGRWFQMVGKGALDCSMAPVTIAVMSIGSLAR